MSADILQARYEELETIANKFERWADANESLYQRLESRASTLVQQGWKGQGSEAFYEQMNYEILPAMKRLTVALTTARSTTLQIKETIETAEQEAAQLFVIEPGLSFKEILEKTLNTYLNIASLGRTKVRKFLNSIGQILNSIGDTRGFVGKMDELYEFIKPVLWDLRKLKIPAGETGNFLLNAALEILFSDDHSPRGMLISATTVGVETAMLAGIAGTFVVGAGTLGVTAAVPFGVAMAGATAVYGAFELSRWGGSVLVPRILNAAGQQELATKSEQFFEYLNIHKHIKDSVAQSFDVVSKAWDEYMPKKVEQLGNFAF